MIRTQPTTGHNSNITRCGLADEIDAIDKSIKALNESKSEAYKAYREQLLATGMKGERVSAEIAATKAAIIKRRKLKENPDEVAERDDLTDAILAEISAKPSRARVRPTISPSSEASSQATTNTAGEVTANASPATNPSEPNPTPVDRTDEPEADAKTPLASGNNSEIDPDRATQVADGGQPGTPSSEADRAKNNGVQAIVDREDGAAPSGHGRVNSEQAATISEDSIPLFLLKDHKPLRPNCLNPSNCAGYGSKTCHSCLKAAGQEEGRAA